MTPCRAPGRTAAIEYKGTKGRCNLFMMWRAAAGLAARPGDRARARRDWADASRRTGRTTTLAREEAHTTRAPARGILHPARTSRLTHQAALGGPLTARTFFRRIGLPLLRNYGGAESVALYTLVLMPVGSMAREAWSLSW